MTNEDLKCAELEKREMKKRAKDNKEKRLLEAKKKGKGVEGVEGKGVEAANKRKGKVNKIETESEEDDFEDEKPKKRRIDVTSSSTGDKRRNLSGLKRNKVVGA
jgi:hypothetical protein